MRDPKRIKKFCDRLAKVWENVPDWRFGQFISNAFGEVWAKHGDIFFIEDDKMIEYLEKYFEKSEENNEKGVDKED